MSGRYSEAAYEARKRALLAGAMLLDLSELCRFCAELAVDGAAYCPEHLDAVRSKRTEMERR